MRAWKLVAAIAGILVLLCAYQLSFTFKSKNIDQDADVAAHKKVAEALVLNPSLNKDSLFEVERKAYLEGKWNEPIYMGRSLKEVRKGALNLGLDLQGGTHATVVVAPDDIIYRLANKNQDPAFNQAIENAKIKMMSSQDKFSDLFYEEWKTLSGGRKLNEIFMSASSTEITMQTSDDEILTKINDELDLALDRSVTVLRSRVDEFGATNPIIHPVQATGRIEIELPGFDDEELTRTQLEKVANLEFLQPYSEQSFFGAFGKLKSYYDEKEKSSNGAILEEDSTEKADSTAAVKDTSKVETMADADTAKKETKQTAFDKLFEYMGGMAIGVKAENVTKVKKIMQSKEWLNVIPGDLTLMFTKETSTSKEGIVYHTLLPMTKGPDAPVLLDGGYVEDAYVTRTDGKLAAGIRFNPDGAQKWADISRRFLKQPIAIVLDNEVYSVPVIQSEMNTGSCVITGNFEYEEVKTLANVLKAGKLPAPTKIERLVKVGPSLGATAINQGLLSLLGGLALVIAFMIFYYNKSGAVSIVALVFNVLFILGIMATPSFGSTLTLDGIAGIVLTIGMAVDANVLIFERIKEELAGGATRENAITKGFGRAFWTIFDANITTFASALVLFIFGSGLVKGFAITLMIGVFCSFFTAVFITQLLIYLMGRKNNYATMKFSNPVLENLVGKTKIDFIGQRKIGYIFSAVFIAIGMGLVAKDGLNLGVAFKGGYSYVYSFDKEVNPVEIKEAVKAKIGESDVQVKQYGTSNQVIMTTSYMIGSADATAAKKVQETVETAIGSFGKFEQQQSIQVGATIADDIKSASLTSLLISVIVIFIYVGIRFRNWQFGLGTLVALFHDILFVTSAFAIARVFGLTFEIDELFIAALLTLVGYSVNDTVVVFDFIRDYIGDKSLTLKEVLNKSLNNTLSRTIMTSLTVLFVVLALLIFGGDALRGFSFALLIGVVVGTYSSLYIATPLVYDTTGDKREQK